MSGKEFHTQLGRCAMERVTKTEPKLGCKIQCSSKSFRFLFIISSSFRSPHCHFFHTCTRMISFESEQRHDERINRLIPHSNMNEATEKSLVSMEICRTEKPKINLSAWGFPPRFFCHRIAIKGKQEKKISFINNNWRLAHAHTHTCLSLWTRKEYTLSIAHS